MDNGVIEWERTHIPDGWSNLTTEEQANYINYYDD
jgi:hypothetical protein